MIKFIAKYKISDDIIHEEPIWINPDCIESLNIRKEGLLEACILTKSGQRYHVSDTVQSILLNI